MAEGIHEHNWELALFEKPIMKAIAKSGDPQFHPKTYVFFICQGCWKFRAEEYVWEG